MGRSSASGPVTGGLESKEFVLKTIAASQADQLVGVFRAPAAGRMHEVHFMVTGTGGLSAHKVRKLTGDAVTIVLVGSTQTLSADGGAVAATNRNRIKPPDAGSTPNLLAAQRNFAKGDQIGFFASTDAVAGNRDIYVTFTYHLTDHPNAKESYD